MPRGPLPKANTRRRNAPTIESTALPATGRKGRPPKCPYTLAKAGKAWWKWAWGLPQAAKWDDGALYFLARRAQLEDELAILESFGEGASELYDLLAGADDEAIKRVEFALRTLKRHATGSITLMREMRELDNRLGLNPKALAELRWEIGAEVDAAAPQSRPATVTRLRAV